MQFDIFKECFEVIRINLGVALLENKSASFVNFSMISQILDEVRTSELLIFIWNSIECPELYGQTKVVAYKGFRGQNPPKLVMEVKNSVLLPNIQMTPTRIFQQPIFKRCKKPDTFYNVFIFLDPSCKLFSANSSKIGQLVRVS